jgi:hypothetical protein
MEFGLPAQAAAIITYLNMYYWHRHIFYKTIQRRAVQVRYNARAPMDMVKHGPGRPPKYGRPSRAVTVTLPEDVLDGLGAIDTDVGRAIVKLTERRRTLRARAARPAELAPYGNHAVIIVNPARALKRLAGVQLVPVGNGRALISLMHPHSIPQLELAVRDAIERGDMSTRERHTVEAIVEILQRARRSRGVSLEERTIIVLATKRQRRRT